MSDLNEVCDYFLDIEEPREEKGRRHNLQDIIVIAICAIMCGADGFKGMQVFGEARKEWLNTFLELKHGIPSEDTFGRVFSMIDSEKFRNCFVRWTSSITDLIEGEVVSIDGKTACNSHDKENNKEAIHLVSAWANSAKLVLAQEKTEDKSNEIKAIPKILELLHLEDCIITIDAMGCQETIVEEIRNKNADYVLALKKNHKNFYEDVKCLFELEGKNEYNDISYDHYETVNKDHGRIERRNYYVTSEIDNLPHKLNWKGLKSVGMVESERIVDGEKSVERRFYITSLEEDAKQFGEAVREHWGVENCLHWTLDVTFKEDNSRVRKDNAAENLALLRKVALNALQQEDSHHGGKQSKRYKAALDTDYLLKLLSIL